MCGGIDFLRGVLYEILTYFYFFVFVLLTVHLSIILAADQLDAQILVL